MEFAVKIRETETGIPIIDVVGEVDVSTSPNLKERINQVLESGKFNLVVNLEKTKYIDSTGLGVLIGGLRRVREKDGMIALVCTLPRILKIFDMTGLNQVFQIYQTEEQAIKALTK